jgi:lysophospholipase L1-like esterase
MPITRAEKAAIKAGEAQASDVLDFRDKALRQRKKALENQSNVIRFRAESLSGEPLERMVAESIAVEEVATKGILIAEGDSWFDYPFHDVLRYLEDDHGYDVESVANKGDPVEEMAYGLGQLEELTRRIEKILRRGTIPRAILLSGGGNDVAGDQFGMLLNHARSGLPNLNEQIARGVIDDRIRSAYITVLSAVTRICQQRIGRPIPIIIHGYDYPVPDGRGYLGGFWVLPGPWLEPGFREKGYADLKVRISITQKLIDRLNDMLKGVSELSPFASHVKYVDLRETLSIDLNGDGYKAWWDNELHPTAEGFMKVTERFASVIDALPL